MGREITVLSIGDPRKISTWSNVPFFFAKHLEEAGCTVHHADIGPKRWLQVPYDLLFKVLGQLGLRTEHRFFRSKLNAVLTERCIERGLKEHSSSLPVFMTYSFGAQKLNRPYVLFSDRTFAHHIEYFHDRPPNLLERKCAKREESNMHSAAMIVSLFPEMADKLTAKHGDRVKYFGNVVNLPAGEPIGEEELTQNWHARQILFIGKAHYKNGLIRLIKAINQLNKNRVDPFHVNVIGLRKRDVPHLSTEQVTFYGYLNKANKQEYDQYTQLLRSAFLFVNPNPRWASFSASCEALFMSTPLIIPPYSEFTQTFGFEEPSWSYLHSDEQNDLIQLIQRLGEDHDLWIDKARSARSRVADFTWPAYVQKVLLEIDQMKLSR